LQHWRNPDVADLDHTVLGHDAHEGRDAPRGAGLTVDDREGQRILGASVLLEPRAEGRPGRKRPVGQVVPGPIGARRRREQVLADVGVVLLLFEVGIEINPLRLAREGRRLLLLAPLQVLVTWVLSAATCLALGMKPAGAAMIGLSIAMSSSVVVVNIARSSRRTTDKRTDELLLGWSLIQDLVGVSAALVLVVVIGIGGRSGVTAVGGVVAFALLSAATAFALPWLLRRLQADHDLFLLVSVASGLLVAGVGSRFFGIPLALAAFVAGLAITESP